MTGSLAGSAMVRDVLRDGSERLISAGVDTPRLDAELLLAEALGVGREQLVLRAAYAVDPDSLRRFEELMARRAAREPVAYILGHKAFRHIELAVDPRALIPRPETELLVEVGLALASGAVVVDVGTGSGAVALALKQERPDLEVWGTDVATDAVELARFNAERLGLGVEFVCGDLLDAVDANVDAVLANLPYVASGAELAPEITHYEPQAALFAGADGLDVVRRLIGAVERVPLVALEVGLGQAHAVSELLEAAGFSLIDRLADLAGHERVLVGRR